MCYDDDGRSKSDAANTTTTTTNPRARGVRFARLTCARHEKTDLICDEERRADYFMTCARRMTNVEGRRKKKRPQIWYETLSVVV